MDYKHFVGIDISKHKLDIAVIEKSEVLIHELIENSPQGIQQFLPCLKTLKGFSKKKTLFCIENTGVYGERLSYILTKKKFALVVENSLHIKRSMGLVRDKTDKKDAHRIALFAKKNYQELRLWEPPRQEILRLKYLQEVRERLLKLYTALRQSNK